jgi:hypothetical protein
MMLRVGKCLWRRSLWRGECLTEAGFPFSYEYFTFYISYFYFADSDSSDHYSIRFLSDLIVWAIYIEYIFIPFYLVTFHMFLHIVSCTSDILLLHRNPIYLRLQPFYLFTI